MLQELYGLFLVADETEAMGALDRFADLYAADPLPEFYQGFRHLTGLVAGDLQLPPRWSGQQRSHGGHQQQARRPQAHGLRVYQRGELRRSRPTPVPGAQELVIQTRALPGGDRPAGRCAAPQPLATKVSVCIPAVWPGSTRVGETPPLKAVHAVAP